MERAVWDPHVEESPGAEDSPGLPKSLEGIGQMVQDIDKGDGIRALIGERGRGPGVDMRVEPPRPGRRNGVGRRVEADPFPPPLSTEREQRSSPASDIHEGSPGGAKVIEPFHRVAIHIAPG